MTSRWHKMIVATSLHNIRDRSAIDLKIESQVPSKIRSSQNNKTSTRLSGGGSDRGYANKNKNEKKYGDGGVSRPHGLMLRSGLVFGYRRVH
ncbi:MAG: hypothetical protein DMF12_09890 [Verrucomicrobia bacterium]|nr:MAG: hypothetical protein AUH19_04935 [Verrucomicrobia bacterium 13_2_20CM_55_10]OLB19692.1 MAG: hypothetical protein AUI05_00365 [Verrucomicrobia bacterium 13_2_20CM_2_54_15_9cls]PYI41539.1 MAG: hypothetical protein DMF12_09890 [Verrucomicrobiota bacterium]